MGVHHLGKYCDLCPALTGAHGGEISIAFDSLPEPDTKTSWFLALRVCSNIAVQRLHKIAIVALLGLHEKPVFTLELFLCQALRLAWVFCCFTLVGLLCWSHFFDDGTYRTSAWYGGRVVE